MQPMTLTSNYSGRKRPETLDERCAGCHHIENGRCKYLEMPIVRLTWPCYFREQFPQEVMNAG